MQVSELVKVLTQKVKTNMQVSELVKVLTQKVKTNMQVSQHTENVWMRAKRMLRRQFGTTMALFDTYLEEFMWEQRHKEHKQRLAALLVCTRQQYP